MPQEHRKPSQLEKTRSRVRDEILKLTGGKRQQLTIVERGGGDAAGYFSMGHKAFAVIEQAYAAIEAQRHWPFLHVLSCEPYPEADILIEGDHVEFRPRVGIV